MLRSTSLALSTTLLTSVAIAQDCGLAPLPEAILECSTCTAPKPLDTPGESFAAYSYDNGDVTMWLLCYTLQQPSYQGWTGQLDGLGGTVWIALPEKPDVTSERQTVDLYLQDVTPRPLPIWSGGSSDATTASLSLSTKDLLAGSAYMIRGDDVLQGFRDEGSLRVLDAGGSDLLTPCPAQGCLVKAQLNLINVRFASTPDGPAARIDLTDARRALFTELWDFELSPPAYPQMRTHSYFVNAPGTADSDGDGVADDVDNCRAMANPAQLDMDGDGYGQACDADLTNNRIVDANDLSLLRSFFFSSIDPLYDLDGNGQVDFADLGFLRRRYLQPPGPSSHVPFDEF